MIRLLTGWNSSYFKNKRGSIVTAAALNGIRQCAEQVGDGMRGVLHLYALGRAILGIIESLKLQQSVRFLVGSSERANVSVFRGFLVGE